MRTFLLCLVLIPTLLLVLPSAAQAEDDSGDVQRLVKRVEMLIDLVADLRAEVQALRERVAQLEAGKSTPAEPVREVIPATPIQPMPVVEVPDVSGVYALDEEASIKAILEAELEGIDDEEMAEIIRRGVVEEFEEIDITLRLEADGTFSVRVDEEGAEQGEEAERTARGTWTRDEAVKWEQERLILVTTHEGGVESESPTELIGTWEDGCLSVEEKSRSGYVMIFRRK